MVKKIFVTLLFLAAISGCAANRESARPSFSPMARASAVSGNYREMSSQESDDRMVIKSAGLVLAVNDFKAASDAAAGIIKDAGGLIQSESQYDDNYYMQIKIPGDKLEATVDMLAKLGDEKSRNISKQDVTEQVVDSEAVLKNKTALRDRLRQLSAQAKDVKDIVAVETELSRVQGEIDSMEATLKSLKGRVNMSDVSLTFEKKVTPGPLGWVFMGLWWIIGKLFVI
jgi:hypothetical protein